MKNVKRFQGQKKNSKKARWGGVGQRIHVGSATKEKKMARRGRIVVEDSTITCPRGHSTELVHLVPDTGHKRTARWCGECQEAVGAHREEV